jgi:hypothetical protein
VAAAELGRGLVATALLLELGVELEDDGRGLRGWRWKKHMRLWQLAVAEIGTSNS